MNGETIFVLQCVAVLQQSVAVCYCVAAVCCNVIVLQQCVADLSSTLLHEWIRLASDLSLDFRT